MNNKMKYLTAIVILCICNALFYYYLTILENNNAAQPHRELSERISQWSSEEVIYDADVIKTLGPDITVYRTYRKNEGLPVTLFMAYYNNLEKADLSHSPIVCFTGQGWEIDHATKEEIPVDSTDTRSIRVNQLIQKKLDTVMITLYWYQSADQAFSNRGIQKMRLLIDKMLGRSDNNAFVRVTSSIPTGDDIEVLKSELYQFVRDLYPEIRRFFIEGQ